MCSSCYVVNKIEVLSISLLEGKLGNLMALVIIQYLLLLLLMLVIVV